MEQKIIHIVLIVLGTNLLGLGLVAAAYTGSVIPLTLAVIGAGMTVFSVLRLRANLSRSR